MWLNSEKIAKDARINVAFHRTDPIQVIGSGWQPAPGAEFMRALEADGDLGIDQLREKIVLLLAIESVLFSAIDKEIPVRTLARKNSVIRRLEAKFFLDLAVERVQQCLALLYAPLRKLPATPPVTALADKDFTSGIPQNNCGIRAVCGHIKFMQQKIVRDASAVLQMGEMSASGSWRRVALGSATTLLKARRLSP